MSETVSQDDGFVSLDRAAGALPTASSPSTVRKRLSHSNGGLKTVFGGTEHEVYIKLLKIRHGPHTSKTKEEWLNIIKELGKEVA